MVDDLIAADRCLLIAVTNILMGLAVESELKGWCALGAIGCYGIPSEMKNGQACVAELVSLIRSGVLAGCEFSDAWDFAVWLKWKYGRRAPSAEKLMEWRLHLRRAWIRQSEIVGVPLESPPPH